MLNLSTFLMAGPCLMAVMAAIALFIVHRSLSPVRHALVWSAGFAVTALRWAYATAVWQPKGMEVGAVMLFDLLGIIGVVILAEGFRLRAGNRRRVPMVVGCLAAPALLLLFALPGWPLRAAFLPAVSMGLLIWSVIMISPRDRPWSPVEMAVAGMLGAIGAINLTAIGITIGEQSGLIEGHDAFIATYVFTLAPSTAAAGLFILLLICFDFSAEQRRLVNTDPLTGVLNRLGFEDVAGRALARTQRRGRPLSLAMVDLDGFKRINDRDGHAAGDATLIGFARHLSDELERDEAIGRVGGEEFLLLLPGCDGPQAFAKVEPMRERLGGFCVPGLPGLTITASFGVAEHRPGATLSETIARADAALYRAKNAGRDRTALADG